MLRNKLVALSVMSLSVTLFAKEVTKTKAAPQFYVYQDAGSRLNHYIPSGWMGDFGDLHFNQAHKVGAAEGKTCIRVEYTGERKQGAGWAGIYWQSPANNWGDKKGGFDLTGYKKVTFMVKGEKGGELIDKFMIGNITGQTEEGDSGMAETSPIELTSKWQKVSLDVAETDLKHIIGGFGFALNSDSNMAGAVFYIDDVRFEK